tara:strand:+ start:3731 stop:4705 length:975 start_codon:yes stop_codon:yes gene_type:complete
MSTIVTRVLTAVFLLGIVTYLLPERQENSTAKPPLQNAKRPRSAVASFPKDLKILEDIPYREGDSKAWKLDLVMLREQGETKRPALIFVNGNGWSSVNKSRGIFSSGPVEYARKGYVCLRVNYRQTDEAPFPASLEDVKCAVRWLRAHADEYHVDPQRIGGYGYSTGAHLVSLLGLVDSESDREGDGPWQDQSSMLNAVCASAIPTKFVNWSDGVEEKPIPCQLLETPDTCLQEQTAKASPDSSVHTNAPPFLLFQSTRDRRIDASQADRFVEGLKAAGAEDVTYHRYEKTGHRVFSQHRAKNRALMEEFFDRTLLHPPGDEAP